jgi:hypothetical protein
MARVLVVGCGCRGLSLAAVLRADGHAVRGTTRSAGGLPAIEAAGVEGVLADPDRLGTIMGQLAGVTVACWLMGSATGAPELHGPRLETLLERLVDTPVRGIVYETAGTVPTEWLVEGRRVLADASERWRIPVRLVDHDPADWRGWAAAAEAAFGDLTRA